MEEIDFPEDFFDRTSYSVLHLNTQKEIMNVNKAACDMLGLKKEDMIGKKTLDKLPRV